MNMLDLAKAHANFRMIVNDLLDELFMEEEENGCPDRDDMAEVLAICGDVGESHDPKLLVRALLIAIADKLSDAASAAYLASGEDKK
jgi:hypothetical protein